MRLIVIFALAILAAPLASDVQPSTPVDWSAQQRQLSRWA
jgi:hypothetical protein